jgi:cytochrome c-type biogenesis protein CcmH
MLLTPKVPSEPQEQASTASGPSLSSSSAAAQGVTAQARRRWRRGGLWAAVVVVAGLFLAIGAGAFSGGGGKPPTLYQRTLEVAGQYRCPVCASESVAVSNAAEAVEIRSLIRGWLKQGDSQAQIRAYLVSDYGSSILEKPPASGLDTLVWVLPGLAAALAVAGLGFGFARWRRASVPALLGPAAGPGTVTAPGAGDQVLSGQIPSGQIPRAASALMPAPLHERLFDGGGEEHPVEARPELQESPQAPARPLYRRVAPVLGAVLVLAAGTLWLIDRSSSPRLPGATATGGVTGIEEELEQAASFVPSDPAAALAIYDQVLASDPDQPVALTAEGWIYAQAGYVARGEDLLQKAEADDPSYDPPHLYRGLVLLEDQRKPAAAAKELKWYLAHGPDPALAKTAGTALAEAEARTSA